MKRLFAYLALLCLLLSACAEPEAETSAAAHPLVGVWVNAGQYSEGRDFVETMTLREDGSATVHLEYRGADYATLEGRWTAEGSVLNVDFADPNTRDRSYTYSLTGTTLTLSGSDKEITYQRKR